MSGYTGKMLEVDLSKGDVAVVDLDWDVAMKFIGGRGYSAKLLFDTLKPGIDPLSEDNVLIFMIGPLTGTRAPASGRFVVSSKSPLTNTIFDSNCGGFWGPELKKAGFDGIIIKGKSSDPVYLVVNDGKAEIRDASKIWGLETDATEDAIRRDLGLERVEVCCIGPAGENQVRMACIISNKHRAAGRGGLGAVMGSKKLKAIAVKGTGEVKVANPRAFNEEVKKVLEVLRGNPITGDSLGRYGTAFLVHLMNKAGVLPSYNFTRGFFDKAEEVCGERITETMLVRRTACYGCPIACARLIKYKIGEEEVVSSGPEYESIWALGPNCGISDINVVARANDLCNKLGLDTISVGNTIGFLMECYEKGLLRGLSDVDLKLNFGNADALLKLIIDTAYKRGLGRIASEGVSRIAKMIGAEEIAAHVKGLELPAYDPRGAKGMALAYATSNRGGCHLRAYVVMSEILGIPRYVDPLSYEGKAELVKRLQDVSAMIDSLVVCKYTMLALFSTLAYEATYYARLLTTATGFYVDEEEFYKIGERIYNLERLFNVREGFNRSHDTLPLRFLSEGLKEGAAKGEIIDLTKLLDAYYIIRGWNYSGVPMDKKLQQLGLEPLYKGPKLQVAIDERYLKDGLSIAEACYRGGAEILEVGTPLIKSAGLEAVREFRRRFPYATIVADLKTFDTGWLEVELAAEAGADIVTVLGATDDYTIKDAVGAARKYNVKIMCDLINVPDPLSRAKEVEKLGCDIICVHMGISMQMRERDVTKKMVLLEEIVNSVKVPVAVAGGVRLEHIDELVKRGCKIIIVGSAITRSSNPEEATRRFIATIEKAFASLKKS
ncbi:MAG: aldehyde ferredoxin oxidoreductase C-terminal domain-containing protein [Candidatus Nezhaarchaeota archaeon]|nr:aldehyde ferredoxin oxidoreductase C-terminal domain-containing protein [Candidatus Nezhaarchaeota archaeon]